MKILDTLAAAFLTVTCPFPHKVFLPSLVNSNLSFQGRLTDISNSFKLAWWRFLRPSICAMDIDRI